MKASTHTEYAAFVGIDWADRQHDVCLQPAGCDTREFSVLPHRPERIAQWVQALRQRCAGRPIAVCLELSKGPLVCALQPYDFLVLFPVNPTTLAKYREAFCLSHAKDDPTDAELALELLMTHRDRLTALPPQSAAMRALQRLVEQRRALVADKVRLTNRLTDALKQYFPQILEWFNDKDTLVFCDFLTRWPTLKHAQRARKARLRACFQEHNVRYPHIIEERLHAILQATPLTSDAGVIAPNRLLVEVLAQQLRVVLQAIARFDLEIAQLAPTLPDYILFRALPGAGAVYAPRLLAAFGDQRERYQSAADVQKFAGLAPVTERSGHKCWVHWRLHCPKFLRQTFVEWAAQSIPHSYWARAFSEQQRAKGSAHQAALRALAFKWIRILYRFWRDRTPYNEATYLTALKRRGSPRLRSVQKS
jgi:transposase